MLFLFTFAFICCDKDDEKLQESEFTPESLNQTVWKGNISNPTYNGKVGLNFETQITSVINCIGPQNPEYTITEGFKYEIEENT